MDFLKHHRSYKQSSIKTWRDDAMGWRDIEECVFVTSYLGNSNIRSDPGKTLTRSADSQTAHEC